MPRPPDVSRSGGGVKHRLNSQRPLVRGNAGSHVYAVNGHNYKVEVSAATGAIPSVKAKAQGEGEVVKAPMAGHILRINVTPGQHVEPNTVVIVMEAMKMETEIRTRTAGLVGSISVKVGDTVASQDALLTVE